jgi:hypothetical protein
VDFIDGLRSYQSPGEVRGTLKGVNLVEITRRLVHVGCASWASSVEFLVLFATEYTHSGFPGSLKLGFVNQRLYWTVFRPKDCIGYRGLMEKNTKNKWRAAEATASPSMEASPITGELIAILFGWTNGFTRKH